MRSSVPVLALALVGAATAQPLLVGGGSLAKSKFCLAYKCALKNTVTAGKRTERAYTLGVNPAAGLLSTVQGGQVTGVGLVIFNPKTASDANMLNAIGGALPSLQILGLGARHRFKVSALCLSKPVLNKTIKVNGQAFRFSCALNGKDRKELAGRFKLPTSTQLISVRYERL